MEMRWFIHKNLQIPLSKDGKPLNTIVKVRFSVMEDGSITNIKARRNASEEASKEAERVISIMPKWKPATRDGKPTQRDQELPIIFMGRMDRMN